MNNTQYRRDFFTEAHAILKRQGYKNYIERLLPSGKWKSGEYVVKNPTRNDNKEGSFSINQNGKWADFATNEAGNDLIGLTAYIKGISSVEACFFVGVPRPQKEDNKQIQTESNKLSNKQESNTLVNSTVDNQEDFKKNYTTDEIEEALNELKDVPNNGTTEKEGITDVAMVELEQEAIVNEKTKTRGEEEQSRLEPPEITLHDCDYFNSMFGFYPTHFFPYKNSLGITVGYITRWEFERDGERKKETRPYVYDHKTKQWRSKFFGSQSQASRPLYNLPEILERSNDIVLIVEGEKTAEAAKKLFPDYVVTTSSGGAKSVKKTDWSVLGKREVILSPDNDIAGHEYIKKVEKEARKAYASTIEVLQPKILGSYVVKKGELKQRDGDVPIKYDLADSLADGWTADLVKQAEARKIIPEFFKRNNTQQIIQEELREGEELYEMGENTYKLNDGGLYLKYIIQVNLENNEAIKAQLSDSDLVLGDVFQEKWRPLCNYIKPTHKVVDASTNSRGTLVEFKDTENIKREVFLRRIDWLGEKGAIEILQDQGLQLRGLKQKHFDPINEYLDQFKPEHEAIGVDTVGWQGNNQVYMLPFVDEVRNNYQVSQEINQTEYILQQKGSSSRRLHKKGAIQEWKRTVGVVTKNNYLHMFAIITALTAPILKLLNEEGGFIHYVGNTSVGKSTILDVAKSVFGDEEIGTFRATDNNLEGVCKNANDGAIFLDEMGEADADALSRIVYMVANGVTKGRSDRVGNAKAVSYFTVLAQSTGEVGIEAKLAEKKIQAKGGQLLRMGELDADRGKGLATFDVLNINPDTNQKFEDGKSQAEYLKEHARKNCGVVIDAFMQELVKDISTYIKALIKSKEEWIHNLQATKGNPEMDRMIKRFSTKYATAVIASSMGVLPYTIEEINTCVTEMFNNWLTRRGGDTPHEFKLIVANLRKLCVEQLHSRFQNAHPTPDKLENLPRDRAGYYKIQDCVITEYWIYPHVFDRDILKGGDKRVFMAELVKAGYVKQTSKDRYTQTKRPARENPQRFIIVTASAFTRDQKEETKEANSFSNGSPTASSQEGEKAVTKKNAIIMNGVEYKVNV